MVGGFLWLLVGVSSMYMYIEKKSFDKNKDRQVVYAFIDSQNLNLGVRNDIRTADGKHFRHKGWNLDFGKFYQYLKEVLKVEKAFIFIGFMSIISLPYTSSIFSILLQSAVYLMHMKNALVKDLRTMHRHK